MGDDNQPSKKRAAGRELSRDNPGLDDEEEYEEPAGTFKKAAEDVLATRRIVKVRRQQTSTAPSAPSSNPFAGIRLVPPAPATAEAQTAEDKTGADTKDDANSESETQVKQVEPKETPNEATTESNADKEKEAPTEQINVVSQPDQAADVTAAEPKPSDEREADDSAVKTSEAGEIQADCTKGENDGTNDNEKPDASGNGGAALSSFQQLSNSQNAFTGLMGTGFSTSTFSFGSLQKDGSPSQASLPTFSFGAPTNGSTPLFGSVMTGTSIGTKTESSTFRSMPEVPTETGEENEETVFNADSALFEFLDGGWKERGKGEVKLNVLKGETQKARLVMRAKGNLRLILNASLFPDMKLTKMDKKGITFACVNIATEGKDGLSTFALKFKDGSIMEEFFSAVSAHKDKPATTALKTPDNSPKASDD
ncbi:nuclear pore complex protein NUP50A-like [Chenopodium quinoa]|uniref:RanBD1 domain-containing protein n=1 Tax=Chenopodium quinoa TaxID=63459 RepID=A0A803LEL5_CHEQI|nr:nuclear pore complex protein NUP50A-like [Chenopodium quinoa]XP_021731954.1 nuclear pore complex protein NUP50A-like [Chenopodium quinoa]XP_021731955.1 nuclear pore complex protein NUP50A-like [Chenopodium quinoa]XP_021731956.1 nuclear pore complex protein NUP50A-like [Chenopodium quinoa]XP_021731957.1 nuclear pore complex protein NUP50A-like [Chenopodium quinoa]XP_021731958.1 nuclear pore complex protein NUP50A-like [Chenopodium quinoa]XP_021731959.1 nuclear pore complex protein NUP50A-li